MKYQVRCYDRDYEGFKYLYDQIVGTGAQGLVVKVKLDEITLVI